MNLAAVSRHHAGVMGTECSFVVEMDPGGDAEAAVAAAVAEMRRLEAIFTTFDRNSPLSRLRRGDLTLAAAGAEIAEVLGLCEEMSLLTGGFFDASALEGGIDPTGLSKGWIVAKASGLLTEAGATAALVNCGGDIVTVGSPAAGEWRVGIRHPWRNDALACVVTLVPRTVIATSARYERGEHLVDPFTGRPPANPVASASVTGPCLARADAFATALAVAGPTLITKVLDCGYESYVIAATGEESASPGFPFAETG